MLLEDAREEEGDGGWNRQVAHLLQANPSRPHGALSSFVPAQGGGVAVPLASMVVGVCRVLRLRDELYFVCDSGAGLEDGRQVYAELSQ